MSVETLFFAYLIKSFHYMYCKTSRISPFKQQNPLLFGTSDVLRSSVFNERPYSDCGVFSFFLSFFSPFLSAELLKDDLVDFPICLEVVDNDHTSRHYIFHFFFKIRKRSLVSCPATKNLVSTRSQKL